MRAVLLALCVLLFGCAGPVMTHGVPNLVQVDPGVWRSGQPTTAEGWAYLKSLGIRRVVKLNFESEDTESGALAAGLDVIYVPIEPDENLFHTVEAPDAEHLAQAVAEMSRGGGILTHCKHGNDRTGLALGEYRVRHDHWTKDAAYAEMLRRGFHPELLGLQHAWDEFRP